MEETVFLYDRGKTAIIYKEREYSYKEMIEGIKYYATLLQLEADDRVMVCLENRPESMMTLFSIWERKGISVNVDASSNVEQLTYFIQDAEPKYRERRQRPHAGALVVHVQRHGLRTAQSVPGVYEPGPIPVYTSLISLRTKL